MMKKVASAIVLLGMSALPALAMTNYQNVPVVDVSCSKKAAANPDAHTRDCALAARRAVSGS
jgi:hypothetical protein